MFTRLKFTRLVSVFLCGVQCISTRGSWWSQWSKLLPESTHHMLPERFQQESPIEALHDRIMKANYNDRNSVNDIVKSFRNNLSRDQRGELLKLVLKSAIGEERERVKAWVPQFLPNVTDIDVNHSGLIEAAIDANMLDLVRGLVEGGAILGAVQPDTFPVMLYAMSKAIISADFDIVNFLLKYGATQFVNNAEFRRWDKYTSCMTLNNTSRQSNKQQLVEKFMQTRQQRAANQVEATDIASKQMAILDDLLNDIENHLDEFDTCFRGASGAKVEQCKQKLDEIASDLSGIQAYWFSYSDYGYILITNNLHNMNAEEVYPYLREQNINPESQTLAEDLKKKLDMAARTDNTAARVTTLRQLGYLFGYKGAKNAFDRYLKGELFWNQSYGEPRAIKDAITKIDSLHKALKASAKRLASDFDRQYKMLRIAPYPPESGAQGLAIALSSLGHFLPLIKLLLIETERQTATAFEFVEQPSEESIPDMEDDMLESDEEFELVGAFGPSEE